MDNTEEYELDAMTVNERLVHKGLSTEFYNAMDQKDAKKAESILRKVHVDEPSINKILEKLKKN